MLACAAGGEQVAIPERRTDIRPGAEMAFWSENFEAGSGEGEDR
jgi:hypothetical protein